jgi:hypothetical protein
MPRNCAALDAALSGRRGFDSAMAEYQQARDQLVLPMYGFTCDLARLEPPPPQLPRLLGAVQTSQAAMDQFASVIAGTVPVPEFFAPENTDRIMAGAASVH